MADILLQTERNAVQTDDVVPTVTDEALEAAGGLVTAAPTTQRIGFVCY